jgi:hypothetical protein
VRLELDRSAPHLDPWVQGVFAFIGLSAFVAAAVFPFHRLPTMCAFKVVTDHPCMACGMTRSWVHMIHGRVDVALWQNPLGSVLFTLTAATVAYQVARRFWGAPAVRLRTSNAEAWGIRGTIVFGILVNWAYVWLSGVA